VSHIHTPLHLCISAYTANLWLPFDCPACSLGRSRCPTLQHVLTCLFAFRFTATEDADLVGARAMFQGTLRSSKEAAPASHLALHVEELVAAACTSSTFTSGEDLIALQTNGLVLLGMLLKKFRDVKDPDAFGEESEKESLLSTMASAITAALKPALGKGGVGGYDVSWLRGGLEALVDIAPHLSAGGVKR